MQELGEVIDNRVREYETTLKNKPNPSLRSSSGERIQDENGTSKKTVLKAMGKFLVNRRDAMVQVQGGRLSGAVERLSKSKKKKTGKTYSTLRPARSSLIRATEHEGETRLLSKVYLHGERPNIWHLYYVGVWITGISIFSPNSTDEDSRYTIFFQDLILPTGKIVDEYSTAMKKYAFAIHNDTETVIMATETKAEFKKLVEQIEIAYDEYIELQTHRKAFMDVVWEAAQDPQEFLNAQNFKRRSRSLGRLTRFQRRASQIDMEEQEKLAELLGALDSKFELQIENALKLKLRNSMFYRWLIFIKYSREIVKENQIELERVKRESLLRRRKKCR